MINPGKYAVKRGGQELEPQEVFLDGLTQKRQKNSDMKELKFEVPPSRNTLISLLVFSIIILLTLLGKTFQLNILEGKNYTNIAKRNFARITPIRADRGIIYDQSFEKLVSNLPSFDLVLDKRDLLKDDDQKTKEIETVARIITRSDIPAVIEKDSEILKKEIIDSKEIKMLISENLDHETLIILETEVNNLAGFQIEKNTVRNYLDGSFFSQVLGYTGRINSEEFKDLSEKNYFISDYIGKQGLEKSYEEILRGNPGIFEIQKDAIGNKIKEGITSQPEPGQSLVLWLKADLQQKLQQELTRVINDIGIKKAAAVAMDPKTGGVLALVSLPSFDNNVFSQNLSEETFQKIKNDPAQPLFNRAVSGKYASGSTIKPLTATAALQEKIISPDKEIIDIGYIEVKNQYNPEISYIYHDNAIHGLVDMRKALAVSCNVYFYTIGGGYKNQPGLGSVKIKNYLNLFGWGEKTKIDLPQETTGLIPDHNWKEKTLNETWYTGDTYNLSIGQGFLQVSPLQVAASFVAIANNGNLFQPQLVKKIISGSPDSPETVKEIQPVLTRALPIDSANLQVVREGMRDSVIYGSSSILANLPVKAAAKTGTAQTNKDNTYINWITVFAPYDNPEIVLTIMIEGVPGLRAASLLVANETLRWYFTK